MPLTTVHAAAQAIATMQVRGAPLIGVTAACGLALAAAADPTDAALAAAAAALAATRPTAINLAWALARMQRHLASVPLSARAEAARAEAAQVAEEDVAMCAAIGRHGAPLLTALHAAIDRPVQILTHCNAGWLAAIDWGTALAPVYAAHDAGVPLHVWVDETRPRAQGAALTAYELHQHGVPHTVIADNAGGHLMQSGRVDCVIVGADRVTRNGDAANKIGTYLKALAAHDTGIPFWVAMPGSSIDWSLENGVGVIPIEQRNPREVTHQTGLTEQGGLATIRVVSPGSPVANPSFDVTQARLITGFITDRGCCPPHQLPQLFPGQAP